MNFHFSLTSQFPTCIFSPSQATTNVKSLGHLGSALRAEDGVAGSGRDCHGATAPHLVTQVPVGTMFQSADGTLRASLDVDGAMFVAARGGAGGRGNKYFATDTYVVGCVLLRCRLVMSIGNHKFCIPRKYQNQIGIWYFCPKFLGIFLVL